MKVFHSLSAKNADTKRKYADWGYVFPSSNMAVDEYVRSFLTTGTGQKHCSHIDGLSINESFIPNPIIDDFSFIIRHNILYLL